MSRFISVPVLWNFEGTFQNDSLVNIDILSKFVKAVPMPQKPYRPGDTPTLVTTLQIEDPNLGTLYLDMPYNSYLAAIRAVSGSVAPLVQTAIYHIASDSTTITDSRLSGANLVAVWMNGAEIDLTTLSLSGTTLTFPFTLTNSDTVGIIFYTS